MRTPSRVCVLMVFCCLVMPGGVVAEQLGDLVQSTNAMLGAKEYDQALTQLEQALATSTDNETRQFALLSIGEINTVYKRRPDLAIKPLGRLTRDYLPSSPYVQKAHYYLGSLYMEGNDAPQAFRHLREVPSTSPFYQDSLLKLDWAAKNLQNSFRLPLGLKVSVGLLGQLALALDMLIVLITTTQGIFKRTRTRWMWALLMLLLAGKIYAGLMLLRVTGSYA